MKMKKTISVKKNFEFKMIYNKGKSIANKHLVMFVKSNNENECKLGVSVSKKIGNAVTRNRVKRLVKESYLFIEDEIKSGYSIVVIARLPCSNAVYNEILNSLKHLLNKHKLINSL